MNKKYVCPCCNHLTLSAPPPGTFLICPVCWWEDDNVQYENPDLAGGANQESLNAAKKNYKKFGARSLEVLKNIRKSTKDEIS